MTTALYSGSFDPVHRGHLALATTASSMFDHLVIVVLGNPAKTTGLLTVSERVELLARATAHLPNVTCAAHHGLTIEAARAHRASAIVRSAHKQLGEELTMAATNEAVGGVATAFVRPDPETAWISSSIVRAMLDRGETDEACALVPPPVADWIRRSHTGAA